MKRFARFIGMLPFAGKMAIRPVVFRFYQSTTETERRQSYLYLMVLLVFFVLFHGIQAKMGIRALSFDSPTWVRAISGIYAVANICVVLTQMHLGFRATSFLFRGLYPRTNRSYPEWSGAEVITTLAVTLGGQIVFISLYLWYS